MKYVIIKFLAFVKNSIIILQSLTSLIELIDQVAIKVIRDG